MAQKEDANPQIVQTDFAIDLGYNIVADNESEY